MNHLISSMYKINHLQIIINNILIQFLADTFVLQIFYNCKNIFNFDFCDDYDKNIYKIYFNINLKSYYSIV
jgi:hypothetical protein